MICYRIVTTNLLLRLIRNNSKQNVPDIIYLVTIVPLVRQYYSYKFSSAFNLIQIVYLLSLKSCKVIIFDIIIILTLYFVTIDVKNMF